MKRSTASMIIWMILWTQFFPEEIVRAGQLLSSRAMEAETAAFLTAFDALPGPHLGIPEEKYYEQPIGNGEPQSFLELVRNAVVVKLEAHAGLIVRSCFSRDGNYVYVLVTAGLPALLRFEFLRVWPGRRRLIVACKTPSLRNATFKFPS